jgi:hypothetical protein
MFPRGDESSVKELKVHLSRFFIVQRLQQTVQVSDLYVSEASYFDVFVELFKAP